MTPQFHLTARTSGLKSKCLAQVVLGSTLGVASLLALPAAANATKAKHVRSVTSISYGVVGMSATDLPLFVARDEGYFKRNHLSVNFVAVGQSQPICQQLIAGALQLGSCSLNDAIQARASGGPIEIIDNEQSTALPYDLVASKNIKSWSQLVGKTVILGGPRDNTVYYFSLMAKKAGYKLSDFQYTYSGASGNRFAALQSGSVAAAILTIPYDSAAEALGYSKIASLGHLLTPKTYAGGGTEANVSYVKSHPRVIAEYMESYREAMKFIYNPKNKAKVMHIIEKDASTPPSVARITFDTLVASHYFSPTAQILPSALKGTENSLYAIGFLNGPRLSLKGFYDGKYAA